MPLHRAHTPLPFVALALAMVTASCASAAKRFEQGQELEQQGRSVEAAQRYIDALHKDPSLVDARQRLLETGVRAIADEARQADAFEAAGVYTDAAEALRTADALIRDAAGVGVALQPPPGYAERRTLTLGRAVDQAIEQATTASLRGDYSAAVQIVERAQERWEPRFDQQNRLNRALFRARVAWAESDRSDGHFRDAYAHAEAAAAVPGSDRAAMSVLQADVLRRGTVRVAVLPAGARLGTDNRLLPEVNDLALDHWQHPPLWIEVVNPIEVQRVVRIRGLAGRELDGQQASSLAREMGARYAVALTLDSVRHSESKIERQRKLAKTRAGVDTAYTLEDGQLETWARVSWREIDVTGSRLADRGDVNDRATAHFHRAVYAGNWHDLDLTSGDRALFEQHDARDNQDLLRQLARRLADKLRPDVFEALLRRVE